MYCAPSAMTLIIFVDDEADSMALGDTIAGLVPTSQPDDCGSLARRRRRTGIPGARAMLDAVRT